MNLNAIGLGVNSETSAEEVEEEDEEDDVSDRRWEIDCPTCSKRVKTQRGATHHRCPFCNQVFQLQKQILMVQEDSKQETTETKAESEENNK